MNQPDDEFIKAVARSTKDLGFEPRGTVGTPEAWTKDGDHFGAWHDVTTMGQDMMKIAIERNNVDVIDRMSQQFGIATDQGEPWAVKHAIETNSAEGLDTLMDSMKTMDGHHSVSFEHLTKPEVYKGLSPELREVADKHQAFDNQFTELWAERRAQDWGEGNQIERAVEVANERRGEIGFAPKSTREVLDPPSLAKPATTSSEGLTVKPQKRGLSV